MLFREKLPICWITNLLFLYWVNYWNMHYITLDPYPTHVFFPSSFCAHTTICGDKYLHTSAHKSTLNIQYRPLQSSDIKLVSNFLQIKVVYWSAGQLVWRSGVQSKMIIMQQKIPYLIMRVGILQRLWVGKGSDVERPVLSACTWRNGGDVKHTDGLFRCIYAYKERNVQPGFRVPWSLWNKHWNASKHSKFTF